MYLVNKPKSYHKTPGQIIMDPIQIDKSSQKLQDTGGIFGLRKARRAWFVRRYLAI